MRQPRVIQLDDPPALTRSEPYTEGSGPWEQIKRIDSAHCTGYEKRWREGDTLCIERKVRRTFLTAVGEGEAKEHTLTRVPAVVDFADILDAATFESDDHYTETPWDMCDGYEHYAYDDSSAVYDNMDKGASHSRCHFSGGEKGVIVLDDPKQQHNYEWHRERGASKQVARELAAVSARKVLDQLVNWYEDGWCWFAATCDFDDYSDSLCGFLSDDDEEYAKEQVADTVACYMRKDGYTILNQQKASEPTLGKSCWTRDGYLAHLRRQVNEQNWSYP